VLAPESVDAYWLSADLDVALQFASIKEPAGIPEFVGAYGMLTHGMVKFGLDGPHPPDIWAPVKEPLKLWRRHMRRLSDALYYYWLATDTIDGDQEALAQLVESRTTLYKFAYRNWGLHGPPIFRMTEDILQDDEALVRAACLASGTMVNDGLRVTKPDPFVWPRNLFDYSAKLGPWEFGSVPDTLLGAFYYHVAIAMCGRVRVRACRGCSQFFVVNDLRQHFCSDRCSTRLRARRFAERRRGSGKARPDDVG
jgi:hypothetical protein